MTRSLTIRNHACAGDNVSIVQRLVVGLLVFAVQCYQCVVRPFLVGTCKFCPSCSEYAIESLRRYGPWIGARLAAKRLLRCHPFGPGGIDPVPER